MRQTLQLRSVGPDQVDVVVAFVVAGEGDPFPIRRPRPSLLSFAGALGVILAVFQLDIGDSLLGVSGTGPILSFLPLGVLAILFGLSMDYQVFLVSNMREARESNPDNKAAVRMGWAGSGRVVVVTATSMFSAFIALVLSPKSTLKLFGRANWWLPGWLSRTLPMVSVD